MSMDQDRVLRTKLHQLECHFTWALIKEEIDLTDLLTRLEEQLTLYHGKTEGLARTYSALGYVQFLLGSQEDALKDLMTSVKLFLECHGEEFHKTLIVTYGNLAWLNYHMKNFSECESYLQKLQKISETTSSPSSSVPEVLGEKGWTFLKYSHKYYERAKECFKKALELEPENIEWNTGYAIALHRTEYGNFTIEKSDTIKQLRRAIELNPEDNVLKVLLGLQLVIYKYNNEAEGLFKEAKNAVDEAERLVEEALERSPDHPHVMRYVAKFLRYKGCVDRSIDLLKRALQHSPNSSFIHHQLALCYKKKKVQLIMEGSHHAKASKVQQIREQIIYHLEIATTNANSFIGAMSDLALHYGEQREISRAEEMFQVTFQTATEKKDSLYVVHFHYATFQLYSNRREDEAIKHYMECLKLNPGKYEGKRSFDCLRKIAEKRLNKNAQDGEAYGILGFLHKEKGETKQAIECYEKALSCVDSNEYLRNLCDLRMSLQ